jgi:hypothetical protein
VSGRADPQRQRHADVEDQDEQQGMMFLFKQLAGDQEVGACLTSFCQQITITLHT